MAVPPRVVTQTYSLSIYGLSTASNRQVLLVRKAGVEDRRNINTKSFESLFLGQPGSATITNVLWLLPKSITDLRGGMV